MAKRRRKFNRYISLLRCASAQQAVENLIRQRHSIQKFAAQNDLVRVDEMALAGVSARDTRREVHALIRRKLSKDDYDVLLITDWSRLTRRGFLHAERIRHRLLAVGVRVLVAEGETAPRAEQFLPLSRCSSRVA